MLASDIFNAYLQYTTTEKHYIICGPEFVLEHQVNKALIVQDLYGGKVSGQDFCHHLRSCKDFLGLKSCKADPYFWMQPSKRADDSEYYRLVLLHTEDFLFISDNSESILCKNIGSHWELKA